MVLPIKALSHCVSDLTLQGFGLSTPLSRVSPGIDVISPNVLATAVGEAKCLNGLTGHGYNNKRIGTNSLRASGAMALKLDGVAANTIMKVGH
jgi:hypothetical protein